ncbi:MAG TPA: DUF1549 and DUF1553 domain-containing protein [Polyangia bacterium]|nr:DUF1549 and DUF1553 domain-containing protein [Polyangia bacterium]
MPSSLLIRLLLVALAPAPVHARLAPADIDRRVRTEWRRQHLVPAPPVDDARFLRRLWLDLAGVIPPPEAVTAFLADRAPGKRARAVEQLLESPRYADHFTQLWENLLLGRQAPGGVVDRLAFREWLHAQFADNRPWDKLVYALVSATGVNSDGGLRNANPRQAVRAAVLSASSPEPAASAPDANKNGAVNWLLKYTQNPPDLAGAVARTFLGVNIQCAQCHDHPMEKWKQDDFRRFTAAFVRTAPMPIDEGQAMGIRRVALRDLPAPVALGPKKSELGEIVAAHPTALDGTDLLAAPGGPRRALAAWITASENPWFARATVNRMWAHLTGRGFVEPIDDFRRSNPAVMPELLDRLAVDFIASGYDLKQLIRTICATEAYQRSSARTRDLERATRHFARHPLRPLAPNALLDSIAQATGLEAALHKQAPANLERVKAQLLSQLTFLFDVDEEPRTSSFEGTIPQALLFMNGILVNAGASALPSSTLERVLALPGGDLEKVAALCVCTLSRPPSAAESARWVVYVQAPHEVVKRPPAPAATADPLDRAAARLRLPEPTAKQQAYEDLFWALLNSSEFFFNH